MTSLLPPNATELELGLEAAMARIGQVPVPLRDLWNPATCPVSLLPWLAWGLSIDTWDPNWSEEIKRARVAQAIAIQRYKGTLASVRAIIAVFGSAIAIREWWQANPPGAPHTFDLVLNLPTADGAAPTDTLLNQVLDEITLTKPARSHFTFTQVLSAQGGVGVIGAARPVTYARLRAAAPAA